MYILYQEANENHKTRLSPVSYCVLRIPFKWENLHRDYIHPLLRNYKDLQINDQLIINCKTPYKAVTTSTISRWCKVILGKAGIDTEKDSSHSTRSASTSKTKFQGLSLGEIKNVAGRKETSTFRRFYDKPMYKTFEDCCSIKSYS